MSDHSQYIPADNWWLICTDAKNNDRYVAFPIALWEVNVSSNGRDFDRHIPGFENSKEGLNRFDPVIEMRAATGQEAIRIVREMSGIGAVGEHISDRPGFVKMPYLGTVGDGGNVTLAKGAEQPEQGADSEGT